MPTSNSYSQNGEDRIVAQQFAPDHQGLVLEIGAWFPTEFSNSRLLIERGWNAVLCEVSPLPLDRLVRFHAGNDRVRVVAAAITPNDQHVLEFHISEDALSTDSDASKQKWKGMREDYDGGFYGKLWVPSLTLHKLFEQFFGDRHPDVVSIDVEGNSAVLCIEMLHMGIRPKVIVVEHDGKETEIWGALRSLEDAAYVQVDKTQENLVLVRR